MSTVKSNHLCLLAISLIDEKKEMQSFNTTSVWQNATQVTWFLELFVTGKAPLLVFDSLQFVQSM